MDSENSKVFLYVEDEYYNFLVVERMLKYRNIKLIHAINGEMALKLFNEHPEIHLVLMDIKMPELNGYDAAKAIKKIKMQSLQTF